MPRGPLLLCRSVCRESKKSPMARSWRSFFRRGTDEEQVNGPTVASEPGHSTEDVERGNGHLVADLEAIEEEAAEEVPSAEEVQAQRKQPAPEDVWEVEETEPAEDSVPEPGAVEETPETIAERQESGGWFWRVKPGPSPYRTSFVRQAHAPLVGVNGTGKTTTIGKLSRFLPGTKMFAAGDTFRAAAIEQLQQWGERTGTPVVARERGADAAAVVHEAVYAARSESTDVLLIDTAGRLHTKVNLMAELDKVQRVIRRQLPGAPHEVLMTVDATTGQNGLRQAKMFKEVAGLTGIILTKLDGTAKGGIALAIANEVGVPIKLISV